MITDINLSLSPLPYLSLCHPFPHLVFFNSLLTCLAAFKLTCREPISQNSAPQRIFPKGESHLVPHGFPPLSEWSSSHLARLPNFSGSPSLSTFFSNPPLPPQSPRCSLVIPGQHYIELNAGGAPWSSTTQ